MNLVVDDAVEVKQSTKIDEEKRRELGKDHSIPRLCGLMLTFNRRPDTSQRRQCISDPGSTMNLWSTNRQLRVGMSIFQCGAAKIPRK